MSSSQGSCDTLFEEPEVYAQDEPPTLPPEPGVCHENRRESQDGSSDGTYSAEDTRNCVSTPSKGRKGRLRSTFTLPLRGFSALSGPFVLHGVNRALPAHESAVLEDTASVAAPEEKEDNDIRCVTPAHIVAKKYQRRYTIPKEYQGKKPKIPALQTDFASTWIISDGGFYWQTYESPEGNIYFRETSRNVSIVTFVDLFNKSYREGISKCALILLDMISQQNKKIPKDTEITIILEDHGEKYEYVLGYYLASWEKKCVFWLKDVDVDIVTQSARVCLAESHIGKQVEYLFWLHAEMFPCCHSIPGDVIKQLKRVFNVGVYDHITSDNSIFPYDKSDCNDILKCLERAESSDQDAHDVWVIARCKQNLEEYRFLNYHGERGARTHRLDSIQKDSIRGPRSILFRIITPLLFFMPSVYMREIEGVWIDETVDWISWRKFADMLDKDWNQSMTPAAVILSANLGLLSVNSIDTGHSNRNAVQIASYISSVLSIFFFITVQVLTHQHRSSRHFTAARAHAFLLRRSKQWLGLESVAVTYSLPTSLFIWSMLTLLGALMLVFFCDTGALTRVVMGIAVAVLLVVSAILLWLDWDNQSGWGDPYDSPPSNESSILGTLRHLKSTCTSWKFWKKLGEKPFGRRNRSSHSVVSTDTAFTNSGGSSKEDSPC